MLAGLKMFTLLLDKTAKIKRDVVSPASKQDPSIKILL